MITYEFDEEYAETTRVEAEAQRQLELDSGIFEIVMNANQVYSDTLADVEKTRNRFS